MGRKSKRAGRFDNTSQNPKSSLRDRILKRKSQACADDSPNTSSRIVDQVSVSEFITETIMDYKLPFESSFNTREQNYRNTVMMLEEVLDEDRRTLQNVRKSVKETYSCSQEYMRNENNYAQALDEFASNFTSRDNADLGSAFMKFSTLSSELSALLKNLLQDMNHNIISTLDSLLSDNLMGIKGELKKPLDKAWDDYQSKLAQTENEKKEHCKRSGNIRTELTRVELAEEMEEERHLFQLQMCEYFLKTNEIKTKKSVDLLQNLMKHCHAQCTFFEKGLRKAEKLKKSMEKLAVDIVQIKETQENEKKLLTWLQYNITSSLELEAKKYHQSRQAAYAIHHIDGDKDLGSRKTGYLFKKSNGIWKHWQRRKCYVQYGIMTIAHATSNRPPATLNLLTCQVKLNAMDKKSFDLISDYRTYHLRAEDKHDFAEWIAVIMNNKQEALTMACHGQQSSGENSLEDLTRGIEDIQQLTENNIRCDGGSPDLKKETTPLEILSPSPHPVDLDPNALAGDTTQKEASEPRGAKEEQALQAEGASEEQTSEPVGASEGQALEAKGASEERTSEAGGASEERTSEAGGSFEMQASGESKASGESTLPESLLLPPLNIYKMPRVMTIFRRQAKKDDELTFTVGELIVVTGVEDQYWWLGYIEGQPERNGVFPVRYVRIVAD